MTGQSVNRHLQLAGCSSDSTGSSLRPRATLLGKVSNTEIYEDQSTYKQLSSIANIKIFCFESSLYYANKDYFKTVLYQKTEVNPILLDAKHQRVENQANADTGNSKSFFGTRFDCLKQSKKRAEKPPADACPPSMDMHTLILDCGAMQFIDTVGLSVLKETHHGYQETGIQVLLANCNPSIGHRLREGGWAGETDGGGQLAFHSVHDAVQFAERWYRLQQEESKGEKDALLDPKDFQASFSSEGFGVPEKIVLLTFISAVILMAILGNLLVMVAVCRDRQLRKIKTNYFIVSLAFADLLVSVLVMPFGAIELVQDNWIYGEMFCLVRTSLDVLLTTASILHLCCISLDRYYAICCQPLVYRNKMTPLRITVMLGGCWVIPTFISFLPIMQGWNSIGIIDLIQQRQFNKASNSTYCIFMVNKPYAITCSVVAFYIPFLLMVLAYYRIYVTAREHARQIRVLQRAGAPTDGRQHHPDQHSTHRMKTETKAAKTLCIIMGCFCLCWAPFFITNVVDPFINYTVPGKLWTAFLWLGYINSGLNPFLYAFLNKSFRRAFLIILCCGDERYRRPSILGQTVPCSTTTINGSTHVLR
ncbi:PREDICTED: 5-hydroxytryptamine receptor 4 [Nipponia nippon]|uniref:5-hydroxytryptamine receptor 4 n=1 Tax=Nipponia nippon TaxID=128390 RepID=UPI000511B084|nr:PREDICTED: 5-hydroxytryptamine receptor 4 [Nipponia nippon]